MLRISQIKAYADGITINATAALLAPYNDNLGLPFNQGLDYLSPARLTRYIEELEPVGYDFHIHAIGDRGIRQALDAIENGGSSQGRHRITHLEIVAPQDYPRFNALNVTADIQVAGDFTEPEEWPIYEPFVGERADLLFPVKDLRDAGARITLSSDWDVSTVNPFTSLQHAVTRDPQAITLEQAIAAYTVNAAYVMRQEQTVGSIAVGKAADLIILDRNFCLPLMLTILA